MKETNNPTEPIEITNGLTLTPSRIHLHLTLHPTTPPTPTPIDEWKLKRSLITYLKSSHDVTLPDDDLTLRKFKDLNKRKRDLPIARGSLFIRHLGFLEKKIRDRDGDGDGVVAEWRRGLVEKMDGVEVNLEGAKFRVRVSVPVLEDFERMKVEWEEFFAFGNRGYSRVARQEPDTIIIRGLPSRWFAEPRVSSKPSMLVTHTIFSTFGKIRNLNVAEDNDLGKDINEEDGDLVSGLHCKVVVQFETFKEFYNALKVLCGRSLQKEGSRMKADYEVTWDKDGFFQNARRYTQERTTRMPAVGAGQYRNENSRRPSYDSRHSPDDVRPKRYRE